MKRWETRSLGEVIVPGGSFNPAKQPNEAFQYVDVSSVSNETLQIESATEILGRDAPSRARRLLRAGDVIFATIRPTLKRIAIVPLELDGEVCSTGFFVFRTKQFLEARFLFYHLQSKEFLDAMEHLQTGASYPAVNDGQVREQPIRFPPLPEQQRIVAILDEAFEGLAVATTNAEKNLKNGRDLLESHLQSVFAERGEGWVVCPLTDCLQLITYGFTNPMPTTDAGPYMVTAKNVFGGHIDYASARHTSRDAFEKLLTDKSRPRTGDVLLTKDGTLGRLAVVDRADLCINQSIALLRPNGRMEPHFMRYLLSSRSYQHRMIGDADGATIKHIYITRVDKMNVAFPPLEEQRRIVATLDNVSVESKQIIRVYSRKLAALEEFKKSLLHQAFTGRL